MGSKGNEVENKLRTFAVLIAGDRRVITENRDPIGEGIPVNVVEIPFDPTDGCVKVRDADVRDRSITNGLRDRGAEGLDDGGIHWISESPSIGEREDDATRCDGSQWKTAKIFKVLTRLTLWGKVKGMEGAALEVSGKVKVKAKGGKIGRPLKIVSADARKKAIEAARLGIPLDRIAICCGFWNNGQAWQQYLIRNPDFAAEIEQARFQGELELSSVVRDCGPGWQGSAWLLERTRGYVARAQLEHTGKGGKDLSISGSLLGAFGGQAK